MKKLFICSAIIVFCLSCKDEPLITTYQIFNSTSPIYTGIQYLDGSVYEVIVYHYTANNILIRQDSIDEIATQGGYSEPKNVPENTYRFRVSFKMLPSKSPRYSDPWNIRFYMIDYRIIERGRNNILGINGGTYINDTIAKSNNHSDFSGIVLSLKSH